MALTDYLSALNADAERRHREQMSAAEKDAIEHAKKSDEIQRDMVKATASLTRATWIFGGLGAVLVTIQAYKTIYPSPTPPWPGIAPVTSESK